MRVPKGAGSTPKPAPPQTRTHQGQRDTRTVRDPGRERGKAGGGVYGPAVRVGAVRPPQTHLLAACVGRPVPRGMSVTASPLLSSPTPPLPSPGGREGDARLYLRHLRPGCSSSARLSTRLRSVLKGGFLRVRPSGLHHRPSARFAARKRREISGLDLLLTAFVLRIFLLSIRPSLFLVFCPPRLLFSVFPCSGLGLMGDDRTPV